MYRKLLSLKIPFCTYVLYIIPYKALYVLTTRTVSTRTYILYKLTIFFLESNVLIISCESIFILLPLLFSTQVTLLLDVRDEEMGLAYVQCLLVI